MKTLLKLFLTMFKIGLFTFGGGYAMVAIIERELVEKKKWIEHEEFMDVIAIAESTPGPIAINSATYIGYKMAGFFGSLFATLGVVLPSFIIIVIISLFYEQFIQIELVKYAFNGIQACVSYLILSAGLKMFKKLKKTVLNVILFILTISGIIIFTLFFPQIDISSIFYILIGGLVGVVVYLLGYFKKKERGEK
ncbi:MAG: chromate transporter [Clostridiales bacterium]|nr:chromate transporter [Clostridiales bacterium]